MPKGELISLEVEFNFPSNVLGCGCWNSNGAAYPSFSIDGYNRLFVTNIPTTGRLTLNYGFIANIDISLEYRNGILKTNGVQKYTGLTIGADYNGTFLLFGVKIVGAGRALANGAKFRRFKVQTVNSSIDLIAVRVGEVGYMYDQISGERFGNAGSGSFILGPDIVG